MAEIERTVRVGEKDGYLMTTFHPPISKNKLFEATTSAFAIHKVVRDRANDDKVWGVIYEIGAQADFEQRVTQLQEEIEAGTGYTVDNEVIQLGAAAVKSTTEAN